MYTASRKLREHYVKEMINLLVDHPFFTSDFSRQCLSREENFIELAVIQQGKQQNGNQLNSAGQFDAGERVSHSDRETLMEQQYLEMKHLDIKEIIEQNDHHIMVRGVAGIGKTTLLDMLTFRWAKKELLNGSKDGKSPKIELLFTFAGREINTFNNFTTMEELLRMKYPDIFNYITFDDLKEISHQTIFLFDGIDELQDIYNEPISKSTKISTIVNTIKRPEFRFILGGRPKACENIIKEVRSVCRFKTVEVCGFNTTSIGRYIHKYFSNGTHPGKAARVQRLINDSNNLRVMASVPVLLYIICAVFEEDLLVEKSIHTNTELYLYGCLVFLQSHLRGNYTGNLYELVQDDNICEILYSLSMLSVETYMTHKVVFTENDIQSLPRKCPIHLEQTGFISASSKGKLNKVTYQFKHLVFQEFLCALNLCLTKGIRVYLDSPELKDCSLTIMGIYHLLQGEKNEILTELFRKMMKLTEKSSSNEQRAFERFIHEQQKSFGEQLEQDLQRLIIDNNLFIDQTHSCSDFMAKLFEIKHCFSRATINSCAKLYIHVNDLSTRTDQRNAIYLLNALEIKFVSFLMVTFDEVTPDVIKLVDMSKSDARTYFKKVSIVFLDPMSNKKTSQVFSNRKGVRFFINYKSRMQTLPKELKVWGESFSVSGPLKTHQDLSIHQKSILFDLTEHVIETYPLKKLVVFDGPQYWASNHLEDANQNKSKLLVERYDEKENFNLCVIICKDNHHVLEHHFMVEAKNL